MLPRLLLRRLGPFGVALTAYELWTRLPKKQRQQALAQAQKHGTRAARYLAKEGSARLHRTRD